ncbi:hypothetical protein A3841_02455 [Pontibacter flavimaris]|uniref:Uncharacterized protein n=1 Tax=Pontibacter flavimaris TaxID=1797110 RepID=A0A1Q5PB60_9BACT|nr:hypothetical protein A3841_02455 [Pontibacter flavimaris]
MRLKHWQVFLILLFIQLLNNFSYTDNHAVTQVCVTAGYLLFLSMLLIYGHRLYDYLPRKVELSYTLFVLNCFLLAAVALVALLLTGKPDVQFTGIYALPALYLLYAMIHVVAFPAKVLCSAELKREAKAGEYAGTFFMIIFWPFCIWFVQPRVNNLIRYYKPGLE